MSSFFVAVNGEAQGPYSEDQMRTGLKTGRFSQDTMIWKEGHSDWAPLNQFPELLDVRPIPPPAAPGRRAHEVDYQILGNEMQFVEVELDPGESAVAEAGAMMYTSDDVVMETVFGDGSAASQSGGLFDKLLGAGKRLVTGESLFCTVFTNQGRGKARVAFAAPYPGKIIPLDLKDYEGEIICQKDAFLCAARGVSIGIAFQRKIGVALFGGEGFIMQRLEGDGLTFVHAGGTIVEKELGPGETLRVDTGCLVAMTRMVHYDLRCRIRRQREVRPLRRRGFFLRRS